MSELLIIEKTTEPLTVEGKLKEALATVHFLVESNRSLVTSRENKIAEIARPTKLADDMSYIIRSGCDKQENKELDELLAEEQ